MKIIHTSDLHIGRSFFGLDLIEDQRHILFQILDKLKEKEAKVLILAGDIYDRSQPAVDAVALFQDFLVAASALAQIIIIPGNHDSSIRLDFASRWLRENGIWMISRREDWNKTLDLDDVRFYCQPWLEASAGITGSSQTALEQWLSDADLNCTRKKIFVGHFFAKGGTASESERPLCVGGLDEVDSKSLGAFDYCALGHLHRSQKIGNKIRYSGSPLAYGFDENPEKSVLLIDTDRFDIETIPLTPLRKVRKIRGEFSDLLSQAASDPDREDFLQAELLDKGRLENPMPQLRKYYPNLVHVFRQEEIRASENTAPRWDAARKMDLSELFIQFLESTQSQPVDSQLKALVESVCKEAHQEEAQDETASA